MRMDPHNMVKYKAHMPHRYMHHPTHVHPLHTSTYPIDTSTIPPHTSTIPSTHLHHPLHLHHSLNTPPLSHTHTSTICLPACRIYRSNNYFRCPTSGPGQHFAPNPTYALRQIRHIPGADAGFWGGGGGGGGGVK